MDPFGDNFTSEQKPAADAGADFLTQEQNEIAALENQFLDTNINTEEQPEQQQQTGGEADLFGSSENPFGTQVEQQNDIDLLAGGDDDTEKN